ANIDDVARGDRDEATERPGAELTFAGAFDAGLANIPRGSGADVLLRFGGGFVHFRFVDLAAEHQLKVAFGIELLHAGVVEVDEVDTAGGVDGDTTAAEPELAGSGAPLAGLAKGRLGADLKASGPRLGGGHGGGGGPAAEGGFAGYHCEFGDVGVGEGAFELDRPGASGGAADRDVARAEVGKRFEGPLHRRRGGVEGDAGAGLIGWRRVRGGELQLEVAGAHPGSHRHRLALVDGDVAGAFGGAEGDTRARSGGNFGEGDRPRSQIGDPGAGGNARAPAPLADAEGLGGRQHRTDHRRAGVEVTAARRALTRHAPAPGPDEFPPGGELRDAGV